MTALRGCMRATMLRSRWKEPTWTSVSHTQIGQPLSSIDLNCPESCATCSTRFSRSRCLLSHLAGFDFLANHCNIEVIIASHLLQDTAVFDLFSGMQSVSMGFSLALNQWIREKQGVSVLQSCMIGLSGGEGMKASLPESILCHIHMIIIYIIKVDVELSWRSFVVHCFKCIRSCLDKDTHGDAGDITTVLGPWYLRKPTNRPTFWMLVAQARLSSLNTAHDETIGGLSHVSWTPMWVLHFPQLSYQWKNLGSSFGICFFEKLCEDC